MSRAFNGVYSYRAGSHKPLSISIPVLKWVCNNCHYEYTSKGVKFMMGGAFSMPVKVEKKRYGYKCPNCGKRLTIDSPTQESSTKIKAKEEVI
jgi:transposase-like protein